MDTDMLYTQETNSEVQVDILNYSVISSHISQYMWLYRTYHNLSSLMYVGLRSFVCHGAREHNVHIFLDSQSDSLKVKQTEIR